MGVELYLALASICTFLFFLVALYRSRLTHQQTEDEPEPRNVPVRANTGVPAAARARRGNRARLRVAAANRNTGDDGGDIDSDDSEAGSITTDWGENVGAKKRKKLEAKAEKKAAREADMVDREDKQKREEERLEYQKKKDLIEEEKQKQEEEEERIRKEEQERKEQEEYEKLKLAFSVEESGVGCDSEEEKEDIFTKFLEYIKDKKIVLLEDIAGEFKMKTQEVIDRIQELQKEGTLTGVIDDRGKFIYITMEELEAVAKFIRQRGRVSIQELVDASNQLINLNPKVVCS